MSEEKRKPTEDNQDIKFSASFVQDLLQDGNQCNILAVKNSLLIHMQSIETQITIFNAEATHDSDRMAWYKRAKVAHKYYLERYHTIQHWLKQDRFNNIKGRQNISQKRADKNTLMNHIYLHACRFKQLHEAEDKEKSEVSRKKLFSTIEDYADYIKDSKVSVQCAKEKGKNVDANANK